MINNPYGQPPFSDSLLLVVEIGNTTASFVVFNGEELLEVHKVPSETLSTPDDIDGVIKPLLLSYPELSDAALCSVVPALDPVVMSALQRRLGGRMVAVTSSLRLPFRLSYDAPETFGADRIALCALSRRLYPEDAVIALDIGTAITVDVLGSEGLYLGGLIMPGLDLMARALNERTARLPLVCMDTPTSLIGNSTAECIRNGIIWGCVSGIEGLIGKIKTLLREKSEAGEPKVIVTGGSAPLISGLLESDTLLEELAVLRGTRYLFTVNAE
ncbi:type III pantothenate kinase [Chlorobium sp. BLA1]|uniref:type III pantothenate kinase n=1 Tax=Candidatus Chlorobium masyuteum TaxID=2716876 RepID=UPI001420181A|nr:type III pantothenate kinase [Candidatus Chlorobium masyuteum]NHQ60738.1 type III pantothenate kinase [Candidatus Chlorobium masyuteum]